MTFASNKKGNQYAETLGDAYTDASKAVIAAVAVSLLTQGGEDLNLAKERFLNEWRVLYENGIVSQKPPRYA